MILQIQIANQVVYRMEFPDFQFNDPESRREHEEREKLLRSYITQLKHQFYKEVSKVQKYEVYAVISSRKTPITARTTSVSIGFWVEWLKTA